MGTDISTRNIESIAEEIKISVGAEQTASDRRIFTPVSYTPGESTDSEFPLSLVTRDVLQHSGSMSTRSKALDLVVSEPFLEISEEDAKTYGIADNSHVKVSSRRGTVYLKAKISPAVRSGTVFTSVHFPHGRVNALTYYPENGRASTDTVKIETAKG
jgi:predicted molibdopterin-dependent oxidoreductase YjgC